MSDPAGTARARARAGDGGPTNPVPGSELVAWHRPVRVRCRSMQGARQTWIPPPPGTRRQARPRGRFGYGSGPVAGIATAALLCELEARDPAPKDAFAVRTAPVASFATTSVNFPPMSTPTITPPACPIVPAHRRQVARQPGTASGSVEVNRGRTWRRSVCGSDRSGRRDRHRGAQPCGDRRADATGLHGCGSTSRRPRSSRSSARRRCRSPGPRAVSRGTADSARRAR